MSETKNSSEKKTVAQIIIENFLKDVDEKGTMPWQRPYERYSAFNYFTKTEYRGINRLLLDGGEYMTANQINAYNKAKGEDFRFQKGIRWLPVIFFKREEKVSSRSEVEQYVENPNWSERYIGFDGYWSYIQKDDGSIVKRRNILRYYMVAERQHFRNSKGEMLPSRIETGEVVLTKSEPQVVFDRYIGRSGVKVEYTLGTPCYIPAWDTIQLNKHTRSEDSWYSTAFHEAAHSTGHWKRLSRVGITHISEEEKKVREGDTYAVEECIAEIAAGLLCAETGISVMETSLSAEYQNNLAYVQAWKKRVKDWGKDFIYIVSQADKAFDYIMGERGADEMKPEDLEQEG